SQLSSFFYFCFFFNATPTTEIYTLSLHDALPILLCATSIARCPKSRPCACRKPERAETNDGLHRARRPQQRPLSAGARHRFGHEDRKSTRLNSSHLVISYAVFCLKKKKKKEQDHT